MNRTESLPGNRTDYTPVRTDEPVGGSTAGLISGRSGRHQRPYADESTVGRVSVKISCPAPPSLETDAAEEDRASGGNNQFGHNQARRTNTPSGLLDELGFGRRGMAEGFNLEKQLSPPNTRNTRKRCELAREDWSINNAQQRLPFS